METANISSRGSCDFISKLPDPILHHILGLLNTKEAVQTCVLSKRWEHLWTFLPSLNFNFTDFHHDDDDDDDFDDDDDDFDVDAGSDRFVKFVNTVLLRGEAMDLDVFRLSFKGMILYDYPEDEEDKRDWIHYAMNHNARVLHLYPSGIIPWSIYTCTSLQKLYLYGPHLYASDEKLNLPNLKKLSILNAYLLSNYYVKNFLSGSPKLEFLLVDNCRFADCIIAHEHLKYLVLVKCHIREELFVSARNLLSFSYEGELSLPCKTTLNMPSLSFAHLMSQYSSIIKCLEGMATCLRYLTNVELLELHFDRVGYEVLNPQAVLLLDLPIFHNLENMNVAFGVFACFQLVTFIPKYFPNLKKLTILQREGFLSCGEVRANTNELTSMSSTIAASSNKKLEIVEVKYCIYDEMVRQLVDTLMDGTKESKKIKIQLSKYESSKQYLKNE